jgi:hypothetical protein
MVHGRPRRLLHPRNPAPPSTHTLLIPLPNRKQHHKSLKNSPNVNGFRTAFEYPS